MKLPIIKILFLIFFITLFSCDEEDQKDIEITVLSTITEVRSEPGDPEIIKYGIVEYCAKNVGKSNINGWEVYFNVHVDRGPQQLAYESIYYRLEPDEVSSNRVVDCIIPDYYDDAYKATLKHVETW